MDCNEHVLVSKEPVSEERMMCKNCGQWFQRQDAPVQDAPVHESSSLMTICDSCGTKETFHSIYDRRKSGWHFEPEMNITYCHDCIKTETGELIYNDPPVKYSCPCETGEPCSHTCPCSCGMMSGICSRCEV